MVLLELDALRHLIDRWAQTELDTNPLMLHVEWVPDERRWLVRMRGEDKAILRLIQLYWNGL